MFFKSRRRNLLGIIIAPRQQFKIIAIFLSGCAVFVAFLIGFLLNSLSESLSYISETYNVDPEISFIVQNSIRSSLVIIVSFLVLLSIFGVFIWFRYSHRIFGPLVPLSRHITELNNGNYSSRVMLRKGDELRDLMDKLNGLAETLEKRYPKTNA